MRIGRQASQDRRYGRKYIPEIRQNWRPHFVRLISSHPTRRNPTTTSANVRSTQSRLVSHSVVQLMSPTATSHGPCGANLSSNERCRAIIRATS